MILVDTGPLAAAAIVDDRDHRRCVETFTRLRRQQSTLLVPCYVAAEACYMLEREGGSASEAKFVRSLQAEPFEQVNMTKADLSRTADLVERYADFPLGATDASVVAVAERLGLRELFTLGRRHFTAVRPKHIDSFTLLPT